MRPTFIFIFLVSFLFGLALAQLVKAQQFTDSRNYLFNYQALNPAALGLGGAPELRTGFKRQWAGLEGAPLMFHASAFTNHQGKGADSDELNRYHSFGVHALTESAGIMRRSGLQALYAYHLRLSETVQASFGASAGLMSYGILTERIVTADPNDPALRNRMTQFRPDANLGLWLTDGHFFTGFSLNQIIEHQVFLGDDSNIERSSGLTAGYNWSFGKDKSWTLTPSMLLRFSKTRSLLDFSGVLSYKQAVWGGLNIRSNSLMTIFLGGNIRNKCRISYFYDVSTNAASQISNGSHELLLGFPLGTEKPHFHKNSFIY